MESDTKQQNKSPWNSIYYLGKSGAYMKKRTLNCIDLKQHNLIVNIVTEITFFVFFIQNIHKALKLFVNNINIT